MVSNLQGPELSLGEELADMREFTITENLDKRNEFSIEILVNFWWLAKGTYYCCIAGEVKQLEKPKRPNNMLTYERILR